MPFLSTLAGEVLGMQVISASSEPPFSPHGRSPPGEELWTCDQSLAMKVIKATVIVSGEPAEKSWPPMIREFHKDEMHYKPRALPSAGLLPFLHSFLCDFDVSRNFSTVQEIPSLSNSNFTQLINQLFVIAQSQQQMDIFRHLPDDLAYLSEVISVINQLRLNSSEVALAEIISDSENFKTLLVSTGVMNATTADAFIHSKVKVSPMVDSIFSLDWRNILSQNTSQEIRLFNTTFCGPNGIKTWLDVPHTITSEEIQNAFCQMSVMELTEVLVDLYESFNSSAFVQDLQEECSSGTSALKALYRLVTEARGPKPRRNCCL